MDLGRTRASRSRPTTSRTASAVAGSWPAGPGRTAASELRSTAGLLLAAGFETTVNLLGNGAQLLVEHPDQVERLRQAPELWPNPVEEVLRLESPVQGTGRMALRDTEVAGVPVAQGRHVTTLLAAANRDPEVFADPQRFDVGRENAREHLALFDRFPGLALAPGAQRRRTRVLRG